VTEHPRIRVMTWNIWGRNHNWLERLSVILNVLRDSHADIIALQEVWAESTDSGVGQARTIAESLEYSYYAVMASRQADFYIGNALLSRWPMRAAGHEVLPTATESSEKRVAVYSEVSSPFGSVPVVTAHLSWERHLSDVRQLQTEALADIASRLADSTWPPIVMGDFNSDPESDEIRLLTGRRSRSRDLVVFQDAWEQAGDGTAGFTWTPESGYYAVSRHLGLPAMPWLRRRLDYIFVGLPDGRENTALPIQVERAWLGGKASNEKLDGSDHYAVIADLVPHPVSSSR
jgi:endonuclease/exonuclease/phosphatase family metal-dependent hydrolase